MQKKITTKGQCQLCNAILSKQGAKRHIEQCILLHKNINDKEHLLIKINDQSKIFWMYVGIPVTCSLADLDSFLRNTWLECCGHLSSFRIKRVTYEDTSEESYGDFGETSIDSFIKISKVLRPGLSFSYKYDFGTTTELFLEVVGNYKGALSKKIQLLIRNETPDFRCEICVKPGQDICTLCKGITCEKCMKKHACEFSDGEDYFLPLLNSPRTGYCGYTG